ncbi:mucin-binding protein, partial [Secundilactobacillus hailunensis]
MTNLTTELTKVDNPTRNAANAKAQAILKALGAATVTLPASTTTAEQTLQTTVTNAATDKGTTQQIDDAMNITIPVVQNIKSELAAGSTLPAGTTLPADSTRTITFTVTATPDKAGETDPSKYTVSYVPETNIAPITPVQLGGVKATVTSNSLMPTNFDPTKESLNDATVTYTAEPSSITATYIDTDNGNTPVKGEDGNLITDGPITGAAGTTINYKIPTGYELAEDPSLPTTFGTGQAMTYTVKLKHKTVNNADVATNRNVTYTVANGGALVGATLPANSFDPITWTSKTDEVTGITTYAQTNNLPKLTPNEVDGYTVAVTNGDAVAGQKVTSKPTDIKTPTDINTVVTYTPENQSIKVNFVDQDGKALGNGVELTGVSDGT